MDLQAKVELLRESLKEADEIQTELDRRVFYLKTLYDVSKDIYSSVETETILRSFLLMSMGNFGVMEGLVVLMDTSTNQMTTYVQVGYQDIDESELVPSCFEVLKDEQAFRSGNVDTCHDLKGITPCEVAFLMPFNVSDECSGLLGLGPKLIDEPFSEMDKELLDTLLNNLIVALKNARSFEEIKRLNEDLQAKNAELEEMLGQLQASMRKVEILESVKDNLSKFVPATVSRMIEKSPTGSIPESKRQDLSVLFLDIEGYTKLTEKLGGQETNEIIEKHFSVFMDAIYAHNGDVNETAGDGLMVLFINEDKEANALEAVRAAMTIRKEAIRICDECDSLYRPLDINMGINSGEALVGAAKFETYSGSRWTYTARGQLTNIAARIGAQATRGGIYLASETARRVSRHFMPKPVGKFKLKNVSEEVEIFEI